MNLMYVLHNAGVYTVGYNYIHICVGSVHLSDCDVYGMFKQ